MNRLACLAFLTLVLATTTARGQEALEGRYRRAEPLGSGQYKTVYAVEGRADLAIGIIGWEGLNDALVEEKAALETLARHGVPAAKVLAIGTYEGKPAYVLERYATGSRAPDFGEARWRVLNERSIASLEEIERRLVSAKLDVTDLQFLIAEDGRVVIADPLKVVEGQPTSEATRRSIQGMIASVREVMKARELHAAIRRMPGAEDPRLARWFASRVVEAEERDKTGQASLVDAIVLYLESGATTEKAREVARAVRGGTIRIAFFPTWEGLKPGEVLVRLGNPFPSLAADLVREGTAELNKGLDAVERGLVTAASELAFLRAKKAPRALEPRPPAAEPRALERALEGSHPDAAEMARRVRERGSRTTTTVTPGLGRTVEELTRERVRPRSRGR